jgi:hypothetical protein
VGFCEIVWQQARREMALNILVISRVNSARVGCCGVVM